MNGHELWSAAFHDAVVEHEVVSVTDADGKIVVVSDSFCELSGFQRQELLGNTHSLIASGVHPSSHFHAVWSTVLEGKVWRGEFCNRNKQGELYWVRARIIPTRGADGEVRFVCFQTDVTSYKRAKRALLASEERMRFFMENIDETAVVLAEGRIIDVSDVGLQMFRVTREQVIGGSPLQFCAPEGRAAMAAFMVQGSTEPYEATMLRADGTTFPGLVRGRSRSLDGKPVRFTTVIDISRQKAVEQELLAAKAEAERANDAKSDFLSAMSHELRTPLNAVLGFAQMLEFPSMGPLNERQADCVQEIRRGGRHLLELINDILELSKIEAGQVPISIEPVAVPEVVETCLALTRPMADKRGITLSLSLPDTSEEDEQALELGLFTPRGPFVFADRTRLKQVLTNLLANAIKYNRTNGDVTIALHARDNGRLRIAVKDTGPGIPADKLSELFQPFNRLGAERTEVEGTGIGLALSKKLVAVMDGDIGVDSTCGDGCTFWFELQRCALPTEGPASMRSSLAASHNLPIEATLLYVEDNPANIRLMEYIAGSVPGLKLLIAHTGQLGIELAQVHPVDLVVVDMQLPDMSGIQVLQALRVLPACGAVPIMALSASATAANIQHGLNAGFVSYLCKPIKISEFLEAVSAALASSKQ